MRKQIFTMLMVIIPIWGFSQSPLSMKIAGYFFQPIALEKIAGGFNGFYSVVPEDMIPYKEVAIFTNEDYPMRYYSSSMSNNGMLMSKIVLFNQEFPLGKIGDQSRVAVDIVLDSTWWKFSVRNNTYFCTLANQRGYDAHTYIFILFDISDLNNIQMDSIDSFSFDGVPLIGFYPAIDGQVCFLRTSVEDGYVTAPYSISDSKLAALCDKDNNSYCLKFEWSKWNPTEIKINKFPKIVRDQPIGSAPSQ